MTFYLLALSWTVGSFIIYLIVNRQLRERRYDAERVRLGAKAPPHQVNKYPFGVEQIFAAIKADKEKRFADYLAGRYHNHGGDHSFKVLGRKSYMTADPKNIQAMLATQFNDFGTGEIRRSNFFPMLGNGIFTTDGKMWEHSRQMMRPQFARDQVSDLELEERHMVNMFQALPTNTQGWTSEVDLQTLFFRLTLDSATEFLLGESVDSQISLARGVNEADLKTGIKDGKPNTAAFAVCFDLSQQWLASRSRLGAFYFLVNGAEFKRSNKIIHDFMDYFVDIALRKSSPSYSQAEKGLSDVKERYVFLDAIATQTRDPVELRSQLMNILLAGRDTTASLLGWVFWELARRPELYARLRAQILAEFGTGTGRITFASLKNCVPLQHVLQESLRLNPVVPVNARQAQRDTTLPRGGGPDRQSPVFIPEGTEVGYSVYIMHRRKDLWGEDALEFKPERWEGKKVGWEYLPFNGGPRICLGQQFALTEVSPEFCMCPYVPLLTSNFKASYVTVRMLQRFDRIENRDPTGPKHHLTLTDCPGGEGVKVVLHAAEA